MKNKKIIIIGQTPPPWGGVAVHVMRMEEKLRTEGIDYELISPSAGKSAPKGFRQLKFYMTLLKAKGAVYHFHTSPIIPVWLFMAFLSIIGKKVIYTFHNENLADDIDNKSIEKIKLSIMKFCLKRFSHLVPVNQRMGDKLVSIGIKENRVSVIPAFIPQAKIDQSTIPPETMEFVKKHFPTLSGYAWRIYDYNGVDRYGIDMMIDVARRLKKDFPNVGVILSVPNKSAENMDRVNSYREDIKKRGIEDNINFCLVPIDLTALFQITDVYIRPSTTDGDPIAVRESLYIDVPTVASDATWKPEGTILHKDRDFDDFEKQVRYAIKNLKEEIGRLKDIPKPEYGEELFRLYMSLLEN